MANYIRNLVLGILLNGLFWCWLRWGTPMSLISYWIVGVPYMMALLLLAIILLISRYSSGRLLYGLVIGGMPVFAWAAVETITGWETVRADYTRWGMYIVYWFGLSFGVLMYIRFFRDMWKQRKIHS